MNLKILVPACWIVWSGLALFLLYVLGRVLTGTTAGGVIQAMGYVDFYLLTTLLALPGILLFWFMMRRGMIDSALGTAGFRN